MEYIVRRNYRHNGKFYPQGSKVNISVLDEMSRIRLRAGILDPVKAKVEKKEVKKDKEVSENSMNKKGK
jgi:hypothetical protein